MSTDIAHIIKGKPKDLGSNFIIRRSLPQAQKRMVGPFIFWDHMGPVEINKDRHMVVRSHPHIGLSTLTWLFSGKIDHRDSLGNEQTIFPGEVNWMTAGKGIAHSERSQVFDDDSYTLEGIQLWVALPKELEDIEPSFYHCESSKLPKHIAEGIEFTLIAGESFGLKSPVPVNSKLFYLSGKIARGASFEFHVESECEGAIYVVQGSLRLEEVVADESTLVVLKPGRPIRFSAEEDSIFLIFGGEIYPEPRHIWWNFVSSDPEKIEQAKKLWKEQGFDPVIHETDFTPLPGPA